MMRCKEKKTMRSKKAARKKLMMTPRVSRIAGTLQIESPIASNTSSTTAWFTVILSINNNKNGVLWLSSSQGVHTYRQYWILRRVPQVAWWAHYQWLIRTSETTTQRNLQKSICSYRYARLHRWGMLKVQEIRLICELDPRNLVREWAVWATANSRVKNPRNTWRIETLSGWHIWGV